MIVPLYYVEDITFNLSLVDMNSGLSSETLAPGATSLTLAVDLTGPSTVPLDGFGIELSGSSSTVSPLASGITLTSFSNTLTNQGLTFESLPASDQYSVGDGTTNFLQVSSTTPTALVDINFTLSGSLTPNTTYYIDFAPSGPYQGLTTYTGSQYAQVGYTETNFSFTTSPEPPASALLAVGGLAALAWRLLRPRKPAIRA